MSEATLDDRGRLTLPKAVRERYGDRYRIVELHNGVKLVPVAAEPLDALRDEFADVDETAEELRDGARETSCNDPYECTSRPTFSSRIAKTETWSVWSRMRPPS